MANEFWGLKSHDTSKELLVTTAYSEYVGFGDERVVGALGMY